jgi:polyphosphate kinase 2 (PPK2 family)
MSKEEQRTDSEKIEEEEHHWKFSAGDLKERECWMIIWKYYEEAINNKYKCAMVCSAC